MIDSNEVKNLSQLSKISLTDAEISNFEKDLNILLDEVESINDIDVSNVPITYNVNDMKNPLRDEEIRESLDRDEVLKNTSEKQYGYFKILKVME